MVAGNGCSGSAAEVNSVSLKPLKPKPAPAGSSLCLACGLCCNGLLFADVNLQPQDDASRLGALGLALIPSRGNAGGRRFLQPCRALDGCRCRIYTERPQHCRLFECALLQRVKAGDVSPAEGLRIIGEARNRLERVQKLLADLGEVDHDLDLRSQLRAAARRLERHGRDPVSAARFSELSLQIHDLYLLVRERFYP